MEITLCSSLSPRRMSTQMGSCAFGVLAPLHGAHAAPGQVVLPADVKELLRGVHAVQIEVEQGQPPPLVLVDNGKGGAGHPVNDPQTPGQPPGKGSLARPQVAGVGDYVPRPQPGGQSSMGSPPRSQIVFRIFLIITQIPFPFPQKSDKI